MNEGEPQEDRRWRSGSISGASRLGNTISVLQATFKAWLHRRGTNSNDETISRKRLEEERGPLEKVRRS
jgi:hypothetical protein